MTGVRRFRNIFFALAALLWLPVSAHCQLEAVPGFEFLHCQEATSSATPKDCSGCCAVEKSQYKTEQLRFNLSAPDVLPDLTPAVEPTVRALPAEVSRGILTAAPPELVQSWHFLSRTALPVRAPSLAS